MKEKKKVKKGKCHECGHDLKYHENIGGMVWCRGSYPNGTEGVDPNEVFYGECHCHYNPKKKSK